jgi:hypothetical protein
MGYYVYDPVADYVASTPLFDVLIAVSYQADRAPRTAEREVSFTLGREREVSFTFGLERRAA